MNVSELKTPDKFLNQNIGITATVTKARHAINKLSQPYSIFEVADESGSHEFFMGSGHAAYRDCITVGQRLNINLSVHNNFINTGTMCDIVSIEKKGFVYRTAFKQLVECVETDTYVGLGNPNAKILFVGKEAAIKSNESTKLGAHNTNAEHWRTQTNRGVCDGLRYVPDDKALLRPGHTWRKYQLLHDAIFNVTPSANGEINFLENIFTTEMNQMPNPSSQEAQKKPKFKERLEQRKNTFFKSPFIQSFPVVVLACQNYIWNDKRGNQLKAIFDADYQYCVETTGTKLPQRFYVHSTPNNRLIIHTNQLSGSVASHELLNKMGAVIREFCVSNNLIFKY